MQRIIQKRLDGKTKTPYKTVCCKACWNAKHEKCVCHCGGTYHGLGNKQESDQKGMEEKE